MFRRCRVCVPLAILTAICLLSGLATLSPLAAAESGPSKAIPVPADDPFGGPAKRAAAGEVKPVGRDRSRVEVRIRNALQDDTRLDFIETPLDQVVQFLRDQHGIPIELDKKAMDEAGVGTDTPVTRTLKGISLESALLLLLRDHGLGFIVQDEVLLITSEDAVQKHRSRLEVRVYKTQGLLSEGKTPETLASALMKLLAPEPAPAAPNVSMPVMPGRGGPAAPGMAPGIRVAPVVPAAMAKEPVRIVPFRDVLMVRATVAQQEELSRLLGVLAEAKTGGPQRPAPAPKR